MSQGVQAFLVFLTVKDGILAQKKNYSKQWEGLYFGEVSNNIEN